MPLTCPTCRATYAEGTVRCPVDATPLRLDDAEAVGLTAHAAQTSSGEMFDPEMAPTMRYPGAGDGHAVPEHDVAAFDTEPATRKSFVDFPVAGEQTAEFGPDTVAPPVQSQVPATLASAPLTTAIVDKTPEVKVIGAPTLTTTTSPKSDDRRPQDSSVQTRYVIAAVVGILLGLGFLYVRRANDSTHIALPQSVPSQTASVHAPEPATITLRVAVVPADARILVNGRDMGGAGDAIVLPRGKQQHAVRIERQGYEPRTMSVSAEADKAVGPISLVAIAAPPTASASSNKSGQTAKPATKKPQSNKGLWKPQELAAPK